MNIEIIKKFINDLITGKDNKTYDIGRVLLIKASFVYISFTLYDLYRGQHFDPVAWATGYAAILAAGGAALGFKASTEPDPEKKDPDTEKK